MSKELLSINVHYGKEKGIIYGKKSEFLSKASSRFKLKEDEIEIYDRNFTEKITVGSLEDLMIVNIKKKNASAYSQSYNEASTSIQKEPNVDAMIKKLTENALLNGLERRYLIKLISTVRPQYTEKHSKKVQVKLENLIDVRTVECQTDKIITPSPSKRNLETNDIMVQSKRLASADKVNPARAKELMDKLYNERRNFILVQTPLASFVKEKYPLLFSLAEVRNEIDRILLHGKCEQFLKNIEKYAKPILSMVREDDPFLNTIQRNIQSFPTKPQQKYAQQVGSLLMISSLMQEERGYLSLIDQPIEKSLFPYIEVQAKLREIFFDEHMFKIYVEGQLLCEALDFKEAILCLIGTYYIFNIKYQDELSNTYIVFEQLYLERKDTEDLDEWIEQIIQTIRLKAAASERSSKS